MTSVAVIAHAGKSFGGGLPELRSVLERAGVADPIWYEVAKSKYAPKCVRRAVKKGADLIFVWGGDGMVQRCIDAVGEDDVPLAILPAGTGNLLAQPRDPAGHRDRGRPRPPRGAAHDRRRPHQR
jgi:diacylglycerol kinase (ATP)